MTEIRSTHLADATAIGTLYRTVAASGGGLARQADEIGDDFVAGFVAKTVASGTSFVALDADQVVGEIHAYIPDIRQFSHVLWDLTVAVHPDCQGQGVGRKLFEALIQAAKARGDVTRIELFCREGNRGAIVLYQSLGFVIEGRLKGRVRPPDGTVEDDLVLGYSI